MVSGDPDEGPGAGQVRPLTSALLFKRFKRFTRECPHEDIDAFLRAGLNDGTIALSQILDAGLAICIAGGESGVALIN